MKRPEQMDELVTPPPVHGHVTVDLCDPDSGRVTERQEAENFISVQTLKAARFWYRMFWGLYIPGDTTDALGNRATDMPWNPTQHLAYWNDATAESSGTEDNVVGDLVGWASRHPVGSPTGKRGVVNIAESVMADTSVKWVFDWTTATGNGTFQSVGWTRIDERSGFTIPAFPEDDLATFTAAGSNTGAGVINPMWWDGTAWNLTDYNNGTLAWRVLTFPAAGGASSGVVCTLPTAAWASTTTASMYGLCRIGTDIVGCGRFFQSSQARLARHTNAGVQVWLRNETGLNITYQDCTTDGTVIWTAGSDGLVRRHSAADGSVAAVITPAPAASTLTGIAYDPTDGNLWVLGTVGSTSSQVWKINATTGAVVGPLFSLYVSAQTVPSTAPYAGNYLIPIATSRDSWEAQLSAGQGSSLTVGSYMARTGVVSVNTHFNNAAGLAMKGSELWIGQGGAQAVLRASALRGHTLGTRSRLASPVTKTSASALKVTYQFNFS